ncbi:hypothetical protein [Nocardia sp. CA-145437]|uniref:hypothetical protein n=1 Tax=Nocardia sp. CA-145437 TaxID=3239980 RepID=UPI003D97FCF9
MSRRDTVALHGWLLLGLLILAAMFVGAAFGTGWGAVVLVWAALGFAAWAVVRAGDQR